MQLQQRFLLSLICTQLLTANTLVSQLRQEARALLVLKSFLFGFMVERMWFDDDMVVYFNYGILVSEVLQTKATKRQSKSRTNYLNYFFMLIKK
jgi:hypothetical protein